MIMESNILIQDDWSQPNVQIEIELQPISEPTPTFTETYIQLENGQSNIVNKNILSHDQTSRKTLLAEFIPKVGHNTKEQVDGNKHLLIEFSAKYDNRSVHNESEVGGCYEKSINNTTKIFKNSSLPDGTRSVSNGLEKNKRNCKNNMISNHHKTENKMIEVDIPAPMNVNVIEHFNKNAELIDSTSDNRDVENLLPIYMTPKFKDAEFPSYPVIEKVESLAKITTGRMEVENAVRPDELQEGEIANEISTLWGDQNFVPILELDAENPPALLKTLLMTNEGQYKNLSFGPTLRVDESLASVDSTTEPSDDLTTNTAVPLALKPMQSIENQMLKSTQNADASILSLNHNLVASVPCLEVDAENPPALLKTLLMTNEGQYKNLSFGPTLRVDASLESIDSTTKPSDDLTTNTAVPLALKPMQSIENQMLKSTQNTDASILSLNHNLISPVPMVTIEAHAPPVTSAVPSLLFLETSPSALPVLPTDGKSSPSTETYNSLLKRIKVLNMSKPLPRPKNCLKIPHRIRRAYKEVFKKDCSVSLPRILLYKCKYCSAARTSMFDLVRHLCKVGNIKKQRYQKKVMEKKVTGKKATEVFYKCGDCSKYYITRNHLMNHIQLEHPGVQTVSHTVCYDIAGGLYHCNLCNIQFKDENLLLDHYKEKHIIMHKCPVCPEEKFISRDLLVTHFFQTHRHVTSLYRCGLLDCFIYFTDYKDLIEHSSSAHGQSILKCMLCNTEFPDKDILLRHISNVHNAPNRVCEECHLLFPTADLLLAHKAVPQSERHATDMTRFLLQCRRCGRYFIKTVDNKVWPPKNSFLEPILCISCLIPSETTLTVKSD